MVNRLEPKQKEEEFETLERPLLSVPITRPTMAVFGSKNFVTHKVELIRLPVISQVFTETYRLDTNQIISGDVKSTSYFNGLGWIICEETDGFFGIEFDDLKLDWAVELLAYQEKLNMEENKK